MPALDFDLDARQTADCRLRLTVEFDRSIAAGESHVEFFLPAWTPGSYLIREYARHVDRVAAVDAGTGSPLRCDKVRKNRWRIELPTEVARIRLAWSVYAHELTVRTADATAAHAYWNHACVLLWPVDRPELDASLEVRMPDGWRGDSALPSIAPTRGGDAAWAIADLDHAIDSPCLLGRAARLEFTALGIPHTVLLDGLDGIAPAPGFAADLTAILEAAAEVFDGALPYERYTFFCLFADEGYGGLEHQSSCTLLAKRTAFAKPASYREFLALCAHELFHAWNVKRLRPRELWSFDYENENYTRMLWLAEGWTAYYDDLLCLRAGRFTAEQYLEVVAKNVRRVLGNPGRLRLSLSDSSFDAWIRLYRPDENTRNSSQNYYVNGAVAAMCLDLTIRRHSDGRHCLDDVLRELWATTFEQGRGYELEDVLGAIERVADRAARELFAAMTQGTFEPPVAELLTAFGITCRIDTGKEPQLGVMFAADSMRLASVTADSPAAAAGLQPGDELVAVQGLRTTSALWQDVFRAVAKNDEPLELLVARRGVMLTLTARPLPSAPEVELAIERDADGERAALRAGWLRRRES
ncbi:MAG: M61 family metallopeptidase [Planctomycetes bacterium]|nr:M61 family metallopeptidase [Planctomycetota bacterium]